MKIRKELNSREGRITVTNCSINDFAVIVLKRLKDNDIERLKKMCRIRRKTEGNNTLILTILNKIVLNMSTKSIRD